MSYQALYRAWRPDRFSAVVGQEAVTKTLRNQVRAGHIGHAYLFSGTRGTGKTSTARIFSRAINCLSPQDGEPCGACAACEASSRDANMDIIEIDAASNNGVDEIRDLREKVKYPPQFGKYKVYIIDEVHMLSPGAFNALLKTLEEPPAHAVFILGTTEPQRLPATVLSRCQRYGFGRIRVGQIAQHLQKIAESEGAEAEFAALEQIARQADGALRDAIGLLDLCMEFGQGKVDSRVVQSALGSAGSEMLFAFAGALAVGDAGLALQLIDERMRAGGDAAVLCRELCGQLRGILVAAAAKDVGEILDIPEEEAARLRDLAQAFGPERALKALELFAQAEPEMRWAAQPRSVLEMAAFRACRPEAERDLAALLERVEKLERLAESGGALRAAAPQVAQSGEEKPLKAMRAQKKGGEKDEEGGAVPIGPSARPQNDGELWQAVLKDIKGERMPLYMPLRLAEFHGVQGGNARIAFSAENSAFIALFEKAENRELLERLLSRECGAPVTAKFVAAGAEAPSVKQPAADAALEKLSALFGRENIELSEE
ncbi:MAG: DNA polymerase III subunit gamma/tau [Christensenellaceae bacterium]|nr:DNA polymerase III subunit gamma/tau [Christensenellaceae bacterium]